MVNLLLFFSFSFVKTGEFHCFQHNRVLSVVSFIRFRIILVCLSNLRRLFIDFTLHYTESSPCEYISTNNNLPENRSHLLRLCCGQSHTESEYTSKITRRVSSARPIGMRNSLGARNQNHSEISSGQTVITRARIWQQ